MSEYIKKEDVIKEFEAMLADGKGLNQVIEAVHSLPTTEIKQDRLEVIKEYCKKVYYRDDNEENEYEYCDDCNMQDICCELHENNPLSKINLEFIDEAIANIKEQEK